jgi:exosortase/archaeosortase family protein
VLFFVLWVRVSVIRALVLLAATVFWVMVVNTGRIVLVTWAAPTWELDLLSGWRHELLGLAFVGLTLGLLVSTDRFYRVLSGGMADFWFGLAEPWREWRLRRQAEREFWEAVSADSPPPSLESDEAPPPVVLAAIEPAPPPEPTRWPALGETLLAWRGLAVSYSILSAAMPILFWPSIRMALGAPAPEPELVVRLHRLGAEVMPRSMGPFHQLDFRTERREMGSEFGQFSRTWRYRFDHHLATASVDYLFAGWHELSLCYAWGGWTLVRRSGEPQAIVTAELSKGTGEYGTLFFSIIDARGVPQSPNLVQRWLDRYAVWQEPSLSSLWERIRKRGKYYQVQLLVTSGRPLSPEERKQAVNIFLNVRRRAMEGVGHARSDTP